MNLKIHLENGETVEVQLNVPVQKDLSVLDALNSLQKVMGNKISVILDGEPVPKTRLIKSLNLAGGQPLNLLIY